MPTPIDTWPCPWYWAEALTGHSVTAAAAMRAGTRDTTRLGFTTSSERLAGIAEASNPNTTNTAVDLPEKLPVAPHQTSPLTHMMVAVEDRRGLTWPWQPGEKTVAPFGAGDSALDWNRDTC